MQPATEEEFIQNLFADQSFVPHYFPFDVELNRKGTAGLEESLEKITTGDMVDEKKVLALDKSLWVVDTRKEEYFRNGHLPHSINLMEEGNLKPG